MFFRLISRETIFIFQICTALCILGCGRNSDNHGDNTLFERISPNKSGIHFKNDLTEFPTFNLINYEYFFNGGGVAIGDINNDGLEDIYLTANMLPNKLYLNKGNLEFEDITDVAGVSGTKGWTTGTTMADVNGDGFLDIYVCHSGNNDSFLRNELFINNGDKTFTESAERYGLDDTGYSTQACFFDYDNDHDLDMFLLNHSILAPTDRLLAKSNPLRTKTDTLTADKLYRNDGDKFVNVSEEAGILGLSIGFGLGVSVGDVDNDGWMDIYVSNDYYEKDYFYHNNGDGTFDEQLEERFQHISRNSMGSDVADINNDGLMDLMTLDMRPMSNYRLKTVQGNYDHVFYNLHVNREYYRQFFQNTLQLNRGKGRFSEIGFLSNVASTDWSWGPLFADFDNDGFKDLFVTNGIGRDFSNLDFINYDANVLLNQTQVDGEKVDLLSLLKKIKGVKIPNSVFKNNTDLTFSEVAEEWGFTDATLSNGAAYGDLDNDGDLDLVVNNINDQAFLYQNTSHKNNYLKIKFIGDGKNRHGIGATATIETTTGLQRLENIPTRGFQSSMSNILHFGLGTASVEKLTVTWPGGKQQIISNVQANTQLELHQKNAADSSEVPDVLIGKSLFQNVSSQYGVKYQHKENSFEDFDLDRLIPYRLSKLGPQITIGDINDDGLQDFFIGGAHGHAPALFIQNNNTFYRQENGLWEKEKAYEDLGSAFLDVDNDGDLDLYVVSGGNEFDELDERYQDRLYVNNGNGKFTKSEGYLPKVSVSGSCVIPEDFDQDGDMDLFVGGRLIPRKYGLPAPSFLLENDGNGRFKDVTDTLAPGLKDAGMVTDAVWSDYNDDGLKDLIVVGEWMPMTVFKNNQGVFDKMVDQEALSGTSGLWNTIAAKDLDNDGDDDYVLGNLGQNSQFKVSQAEPMTMYTYDFDNNGSYETIISYYIEGEEVPLASRDELISQINTIHKKYRRYVDYANEKVEDLFSQEALSKANKVKVDLLASVKMRNDEGVFILETLPKEAQFSPNFAVIMEDFTKDGQQDILMAGNNTDIRPILGRYDAGMGILILGDVKDEYLNASTAEYGIPLNGTIRDLKTIELQNGDRILLAAHNDGPLELYKY